MPETETDQWTRKPWSNTDEDGDAAYVRVTATTATAEAAAGYLIGEGAEEALGCGPGPYGQKVKADAEPELTALTIRVPRAALVLPVVPLVLRPRDLFERGEVTGWWEFADPYELTEELEDEVIQARFAAQDAESRRRAREDRGPWWWQFRCWFGDQLARAASRTIPDDRSSVGWREGDVYVVHQVRGWGRSG